MRARSALTTDLDGLYAAQRLSMVRLALLLLGDRSSRSRWSSAPSSSWSAATTGAATPARWRSRTCARVVAECRAVRRGRPAPVDRGPPDAVRDTVDDVARPTPAAARGRRAGGLGAAQPVAGGGDAADERASGRSRRGSRRSSPLRRPERALRRDRDRRSAGGGPGAPGGRRSAPTTCDTGSARSSTRTPAGPPGTGAGGCSPSAPSSSWPSASRWPSACSATADRADPGPPALPAADHRGAPTASRPRPSRPGTHPARSLVPGRRWVGGRRDGFAADRGHDDAAAGEPGRDPLRPRAARPTASSSRT